MAERLAEHLAATARPARTVTTKLRYRDFSIRTRSLTLDVAVDDAETIGDIACRLLDRALADRPGALRLVGVGVEGPRGAPAARVFLGLLELFDLPAARRAAVHEADVQAVLAVLPELDRRRDQAVAAPELGRSTSRPSYSASSSRTRASSSSRDANGSLWRDASALMRLSRGRARKMASDSSAATRSTAPSTRTCRPERMPVEEQRGPLVLRELASLAARVAGREDEAPLVGLLQQQHPRRRLSRSGRRREREGLGKR